MKTHPVRGIFFCNAFHTVNSSLTCLILSKRKSLRRDLSRDPILMRLFNKLPKKENPETHLNPSGCSATANVSEAQHCLPKLPLNSTFSLDSMQMLDIMRPCPYTSSSLPARLIKKSSKEQEMRERSTRLQSGRGCTAHWVWLSEPPEGKVQHYRLMISPLGRVLYWGYLSSEANRIWLFAEQGAETESETVVALLGVYYHWNTHVALHELIHNPSLEPPVIASWQSVRSFHTRRITPCKRSFSEFSAVAGISNRPKAAVATVVGPAPAPLLGGESIQRVEMGRLLFQLPSVVQDRKYRIY